MIEHKNVVWGTKCSCGKEVYSLQEKYHPWVSTDAVLTLKCACGKIHHVTQNDAMKYYNEKIYDCFKNISGTVLDIGCGGGFITQYASSLDEVEKVYALDMDESAVGQLDKVTFIQDDLVNMTEYFKPNSIDYIISRDVFMFVFDTTEYFNDITSIVKKGIYQMGWYMKHNERMQNHLTPEEIKGNLEKRGFKVTLEYLDWYKCGYFIKALK